MSVAAAGLSIVALIWSAPPPQAAQDEQAFYGAAVNFANGECWFWTGDVGLTAQQFQNDLASRFDRRRGIIISHTADTPARCVKLARRSAMRAGFETVKAVIRADAGPIGPPLNGS